MDDDEEQLVERSSHVPGYDELPEPEVDEGGMEGIARDEGIGGQDDDGGNQQSSSSRWKARLTLKIGGQVLRLSRNVFSILCLLDVLMIEWGEMCIEGISMHN